MVSLRAYSPPESLRFARAMATATRSFAFMVLCSLLAVAPQATGAEDELRTSTSLELVPADAAFYRACLRNREQFDAVMNSNAIERLLERPRMAQWLVRLKARWENPDRSLIGRWLSKPENQETLDFAVEALSQEVFWYGDASFADLLDLTAYVNQTAASAQLEALRGGRSLADSERAAAYAALGIVAEDPKELRVPPVVIGFRVSDRERAQRQIDRIGELLQGLLDKPRPAQNETIAGNQFRTWRISGGMLPWDLIPKYELDKVDPQLRRRVLAVLESKNAVLSVGLRDDYLLVSLGESNDHLAQLGQGPLLADRAELAPIFDYADRPLNTIVYVSEAYRERAEAAERHQFTGSFLLEEFIKHPDGLAQGNAAVDEKLRRELIADMKHLTAQISDVARARGATLRFSFLTPQGYEGFHYDWSQRWQSGSDDPLTVLKHLGGEPLGFFALRRPWAVEDYDQWVTWVKRGVYYFEKIGLPEMSEDRRAAYVQMRRQLEPQLARLDRTTRDLLIPSVADGQKAIVLDSSPRFETEFVERGGEGDHPASLPADSLPGLELACVLGVTDHDQFRRACQEYLAVAGELWSGLRSFLEEAQSKADARTDAPRFRLPKVGEGEDLKPRVETTAEGEIYYYELPSRWRAAARIAPNLGLSENVAVMSWLPVFSQRLMNEQPLKLETDLIDAEQPLTAAVHLNFAGIVDAIEPWLLRASERRQERLAAREAQQREPAAAPVAPNSRAAPAAATQKPPSAAAKAPSARIPTPPPPPVAASPIPRAPNTATQRAASTRAPQPPAANPAPRATAAAARAPSANEKPTPPAPVSPEEAKERLQFLLELVRCIRSFSAATYHESDALITHYQIRIQDME
jgi:hypothetical protein